MTRADIYEKLKDVLMLAGGFERRDLDKIDDDSDLQKDLGLNSVGILYVVVAIEEFFRIEFNDVSFSDFKTVGNVVDYIQKKVD